ncbi:ATP-binding protein, partial [Roseisolibacter sp. H3M3-2]|uniref:ATP-binding protein n=1 Tax=Roseisolibacter sp. H3M3-2 TaxID=3031323 RepID=UPI0023DA57F8
SVLGGALRRDELAAERDRHRADAESARADAARAVARTTRLQGVTAALVPPLSPAEVARVIVEQAMQALGAQAGVLALHAPGEDAMTVAHAAGFSEATLALWRKIPLTPDTPLGVAALSGAPVVVGSSEERDARFPALRAAPVQFASSVTVPLPVAGRTLGALGLSFAATGAVVAADTELMIALGRQCAQALQRAAAYAAEHQARTAAERSADRTAQLQAVTAALSQALTTEAITRIVVDAGVRALGADAGNLAVLDAGGQVLAANYAVNVPHAVVARWDGLRLDATDPMAEAVRTREVVHYASAAERVERWGGPAPRLESAIMVPIHAGDRALGGWALAWRERRLPSWEERAFLRALGHQAALALERARLYEAERSTRDRLSRVLSQFPGAAAYLAGPDLVFEAASEAYVRAVGGRPVVGRPVREVLPELESSFITLLERVFATGERVSGAGVRARWDRDGDGVPEEHVVDFVYQPLLAAEGGARRVEGVVAFVQDQTARHAAEATLRERETALRLALDIAALGMWTWDPATGLFDADARSRELIGLPPDGPRVPLDRFLADAVHPDDRAAVWAGLADAIDPATPTRPSLEFRVLRPDGSERWASALARTEFAEAEDGARRPVRVTGTLMDRTAARLAEREREQALADSERARADAEGANRAKSDFLAVMSHELRTPLNAIGGYAELLELGIRGPVTDAQRDDLARIRRSERHLLGLINDLLTFARLESGTLHYDIADVPARDVVQSVEAFVAPLAAARGLSLAVAPPADGTVVRADVERLRQVLLNLLSNAVKFTEPGGRVALRVEARGGRTAFVVEDTGIGIPADQLERIFEPFVQVRGGLTRTHDGTGLGLAISRDLVRAMGGDLRVASAVGAGSTFEVLLPPGAAP